MRAWAAELRTRAPLGGLVSISVTPEHLHDWNLCESSSWLAKFSQKFNQKNTKADGFHSADYYTNIDYEYHCSVHCYCYCYHIYIYI